MASAKESAKQRDQDEASESLFAKVRHENRRGKAAYALARGFLIDRIGLVVLRIIGVGAADFVGATALGAIILTLLMSVATEPVDELIWLWAMARTISTPAFMLGAAGVLVSAMCASFLFDALTESFVWSSFQASEETNVEDRSSALKRFFRRALDHTPSALAWLVMRAAIRIAMVLVGLSTYVGIVLLNIRHGGSPWLVSMATAGLYAAGILYVVLLQLGMEWIPACLVVGDARNLGEAALHAAERAMSELLATYRLIVQSLAWALPAILLWGVAQGLQIWALDASSQQLDVAASYVVMLANMLMTMSLTMVGMLVRVGLFELERERVRGDDGSILSRAERVDTMRTRRAEGASAYEHLGVEGSDGIARVSIEEFMPEDQVNILSISSVLSVKGAAEEE